MTLFADHPDTVKEIVYTMRYDVASVQFGIFGSVLCRDDRVGRDGPERARCLTDPVGTGTPTRSPAMSRSMRLCSRLSRLTPESPSLRPSMLPLTLLPVTWTSCSTRFRQSCRR